MCGIRLMVEDWNPSLITLYLYISAYQGVTRTKKIQLDCYRTNAVILYRNMNKTISTAEVCLCDIFTGNDKYIQACGKPLVLRSSALGQAECAPRCETEEQHTGVINILLLQIFARATIKSVLCLRGGESQKEGLCPGCFSLLLLMPHSWPRSRRRKLGTHTSISHINSRVSKRSMKLQASPYCSSL